MRDMSSLEKNWTKKKNEKPFKIITQSENLRNQINIQYN